MPGEAAGRGPGADRAPPDTTPPPPAASQHRPGASVSAASSPRPQALTSALFGTGAASARPHLRGLHTSLHLPRCERACAGAELAYSFGADPPRPGRLATGAEEARAAAMAESAMRSAAEKYRLLPLAPAPEHRWPASEWREYKHARAESRKRAKGASSRRGPPAAWPCCGGDPSWSELTA